MRVYLPATTTVLRTLVDDGQLAGPHTAFAVTPQLREFYARSDAEADQEELVIQVDDAADGGGEVGRPVHHRDAA